MYCPGVDGQGSPRNLVDGLASLKQNICQSQADAHRGLVECLERERERRRRAEELAAEFVAETERLREDLAKLRTIADTGPRSLFRGIGGDHTRSLTSLLSGWNPTVSPKPTESDAVQQMPQPQSKPGLLESFASFLGSPSHRPERDLLSELSPQGKHVREQQLDRSLLKRMHKMQAHWNHQPLEAIIFEGGGTKGMVYAGAVQRLEQEKGLLERIKYFAGTSAGAQTAALCAVGYNGKELEEVFLNTPWNKLLDSSSCMGCLGCIPNIFRLVTKHGWCKGEVLQKHLEELISAKMGPKCTLERLYLERGVVLRVGACNVTTRRFELLDYRTHPHMLVSVAARASSNIPGVFVPVEHKSFHHPGKRYQYVDGGLEGNIPIKSFPGRRALAFDLMSTGDWTKEHGTHVTPDSFYHFASTILDMVMNSAQSSQGLNADGPTVQNKGTLEIVKIHCGSHGMMETNLSQKEILAMVAAGWDAVDDFLESGDSCAQVV